jgi:hypothetical protein
MKKIFFKQMVLLGLMLAVLFSFGGEVNGTVKKVVKGKAKNLKDAKLIFTYKKDTSEVYKTVTDLMGSYTIYLPKEGDYMLELAPKTEAGTHDASKIDPVSIVSFENLTRYDLELRKEDNEWILDKK